jgi:hypothetical protein
MVNSSGLLLSASTPTARGASELPYIKSYRRQQETSTCNIQCHMIALHQNLLHHSMTCTLFVHASVASAAQHSLMSAGCSCTALCQVQHSHQGSNGATCMAAV